MEFINLVQVSKSFFLKKEEINVLKDVNLLINEGDFVVILGASGQGKSTLLNLVAGIDKPTSGQINVCGEDISQYTSDELSIWRSKNIGIVFQSYNLMPYMTAVDNVALPLAFRGMNKKNRMKKAADLLKTVGLKDRINHHTNLLSGGEQQRVAIARALANNPKVLIADEPTGDLDMANATDVMEIIYDLYKERATTIIMATHNPNYAKYADKVIYIAKGEVSSQNGIKHALN